MLTQNDLSQISEIVKQIVREEIGKAKIEIKQDFRNELRKVEYRLTKKLNLVSNSLDNDIVDHRKRIKRIETHLKLPPIN